MTGAPSNYPPSSKSHLSIINSGMGFSAGSDSKESAYNAGDLGSVSGLGRSPGGENGNTFSVLPGEANGQTSLVGY